MRIQQLAAEAVSAASRAALRHVFRRPAGNFPGKVALSIDPNIMAEAARKLRAGSICVVGTNGKTTVTNMLADCLVAAGQQVVCNRGGANLDSGVATSLLAAHAGDWGVFECDELWLVKILPHLHSRYVVLLNLFYDQIDRVGEIERIQESIAEALRRSPKTTLIYNADDPHCEKIANMVENACVPFGMGEGLDTYLGAATTAHMCQNCDAMLDYSFRTYSQLGAYSCPNCGFTRSHPKFLACNCQVGAGSTNSAADAADAAGSTADAADAGSTNNTASTADAADSTASAPGMAFDVVAATDERAVAGGAIAHIEAPFTGTYMLYNLLAVFTVAHLVGLSNNVIQLSARTFNQHNGRLESLNVHGRDVLLNLAKNPTGFNQNLGLVLQEEGPVAVGFFVNDMEGDGRDVSWIWDVNFEALAGRANTMVYVGGMRAHDLLVRLKYAGIPALVVENASDLMSRASCLDEAYKVFIIANYTSLPEVRAECMHMIEAAAAPMATQAQRQQPSELPNPACEGDPVHIVHLYPDLLDQGGDAGNVRVLEKRCLWRGIPAQVDTICAGETPNFEQADIVVLGDGFDRQQHRTCDQLRPVAAAFASYVEADGVVLAIDGGLQILGSTWSTGEETLEGLGVLAMESGRAQGKMERIVGDIVVETSLVESPVVGFENHEGVTQMGGGVQPFGQVLKGVGNNTDDASEGILYKNLLGTYVHGPVLAKSPELADWLLARALERKGDDRHLAALDDTAEHAARSFMLERLKLA